MPAISFALMLFISLKGFYLHLTKCHHLVDWAQVSSKADAFTFQVSKNIIKKHKSHLSQRGKSESQAKITVMIKTGVKNHWDKMIKGIDNYKQPKEQMLSALSMFLPQPSPRALYLHCLPLATGLPQIP